jgi:ribosome modulation factor
LTDRKLTQNQIATRALDLCETLRAIDAENEDFADLRATHKAALEKLENRSTRLRREIETGIAEEEQMHLDDASDAAPEKDPETATYEAGRLARETGKPLESCPYPEGAVGMGAELRKAWVGGWEDADTAAALQALEADDEPADDVTADELEATADPEPGEEPDAGDAEYAEYLALIRAEGAEAFAKGLSEADCPYTLSDADAVDERKAWIGGWNDAEAAADEVNNLEPAEEVVDGE